MTLPLYYSGGEIIQTVVANRVLGSEAKWIAYAAEIKKNKKHGQRPRVVQRTNGQFAG